MCVWESIEVYAFFGQRPIKEVNMNKEAVRPEPKHNFNVVLIKQELFLTILKQEDVAQIEQEMEIFCTRFFREQEGQSTRIFGRISELYDYDEVYQYFVDLTECDISVKTNNITKGKY